MSRSPRTPMRSPAFPDIPIYLDTGDERITAKTYGTTPTTPTTPDIIPPQRPTHLSPSHINAPPISPAEPSPTTTIETSSCRSVIWPIPEPPPEIQHQSDSRRPTLRFFPTERPRVRLDTVHSLQVPSINEKTPISYYNHPGLGILNGPPKPPSIEISPPINEKSNPEANIAQRIEETLWRYSASGNILKRWLLEVLSWLFSAICMAAVIGVLIRLKDEPLTKWALAEKTGLTLNAYISILSKMAGAALILPVSEALGQLKWSWFLEHSKQMWDFEIFDNASRGPWGSFLLLIRTKGRALAALGAMIMLCSLALDPFFQQVVDFPNRWALQDTASLIPKVASYTPFYTPEFFQGFEMNFRDPALRPVISQFFIDNGTQPVPFGNGTRPEIPLSCPTSNCTWPPYETLGVCSECVDVSPLLEWDCIYTRIDWSANQTGPIEVDKYPNSTVCGYFLNKTSDAPVLMSGYILDDADDEPIKGEALIMRALPLTDMLDRFSLFQGSINFRHVRNPILDALIASVDGGSAGVYRNETPVIHECVLAWCVKTIESSYAWGSYDENVTSTYLNGTSGPFPWTSVPVELEGENATMTIYADDINITPPPSSRNLTTGVVFNDTYHLSNTTASNVIIIFDDFFPSYYTAATSTEKPMLRYKNFADGPSMRKLAFNPLLAPNNITHHFERLATAMTNVVRSSDESKNMLGGKAYNQENYVSVRWEWLTLPIGLLLISLVFLSATVAKSAMERDRVGVWKTSAYATLLYGLPDEMQQRITRSSSTGTPRAKAKELKVKLQPNQGWRVSGNLFSPFVAKPKPNLPPPGWI
ncbi:hypothetical protein J4E86_006192 [Alternaria arbusti]|uniref:uncharacterized protein n=1 Tax=Alternaria arbusti TaxID=232088 RepID=UPI00221F064F|nr:uncharacterized protein J4E86_006192 [Alternaria arbusti]KAI4954882.1 hypothetical protein J4E86_006192 [Alternaria arbusti]